MNEADKYIAECQFRLSIVFLFGYFVILLLFMLGFARIPTDYKEAFVGLLTLMTGGGLTILHFWFQRTRVSMSGPTEDSNYVNRDNRTPGGVDPNGGGSGVSESAASASPVSTGVRSLRSGGTATDGRITS